MDSDQPETGGMPHPLRVAAATLAVLGVLFVLALGLTLGGLALIEALPTDDLPPADSTTTTLAPATTLALPPITTTVAPTTTRISTRGPVMITGEGTAVVNIALRGDVPIRFSFTAEGAANEPQGHKAATGHVRISTVTTDGGWELEGTMHCVRDLSPFAHQSNGGLGVWEVRFVADQSNHEYLEVGKYASLYVRDEPDGIYMIDAPISWDDTTCGPRGELRLVPLLDGDIEVDLTP